MNRMFCVTYLALHLTACNHVVDSGDLRTNEIYLNFHVDGDSVGGTLTKNRKDSYTSIELSDDDSLTLSYGGVEVPMTSRQDGCGKAPCGPRAVFSTSLPAPYEAGELVSVRLERGDEGEEDAIDNQVRLPARPAE